MWEILKIGRGYIMPKVHLTSISVQNEVAIKVYKHISVDYPREKLCKLMGYSLGTHRNRKRDPESFTLRELRIMYKLSDAPDEVFLRMLRDDKHKR